MSLEVDKKAALLEIRKKQIEAAKVDNPAPVPVEAKTAEPESTEESSKPMAQETPKEQPKKEEVQEQEPISPEIDETPEQPLSWDADEVAETPTKVETPKYDFSKLGSALGLNEIKSEDEVVAKVTELNSKLKQLEDAPLIGVPEDFKEVIEVAKISGDGWKDYLAQQIVDYSKVEPDQLFEDEFFRSAARNPKFFTDGKFNESLAVEAYEAIPDYYKISEGQRIQSSKIQEQRQKQHELKARAEAKVAQAEKVLSQATKNLQELLPFESHGIKFESKHSAHVYQGITNSTLTKKHLGVDYATLVRSGADMKSVARTIAASEYAEKMLQFKANSAKTQGKKELLEKTQNAEIRTPGSRITAEDATKKELTPAEKLAKHKASQRRGL